MGNLAIAAEPLPLSTDEGGTIRIGGTRVTLDSVVHAFQQGSAAEDIVRQFPSLSLADVYAVIGYYLRHQGEVETYLEQQAREAEELRQRVGVKTDMDHIRGRLLARRHRLG